MDIQPRPPVNPPPPHLQAWGIAAAKRSAMSSYDDREDGVWETLGLSDRRVSMKSGDEGRIVATPKGVATPQGKTPTKIKGRAAEEP